MNKKSFLLGMSSFVVLAAATIGVVKMGRANAATTTPCIVTLFGKQYDVTSLYANSPNMFNCGTDMTATYTSVHGTDVTMMIPYLVPDPTVTPDPTSTPDPTVTPEPTTIPEPTITPEPTTAPDPTVTPSPTTAPTPRAKVCDKDDDDEVGEVEKYHEPKVKLKKTRKINRGHHLVGAKSAHGVMDNTLKREDDD